MQGERAAPLPAAFYTYLLISISISRSPRAHQSFPPHSGGQGTATDTVLSGDLCACFLLLVPVSGHSRWN